MTATFTKSKIMDMVNKAVLRVRRYPGDREAMYYALYYVAAFDITEDEFDKLIFAPDEEPGHGLYRVTLWEVTRRTYDAFR